MRLNGKVAVVTGGGGGIGEALARRFAAEGAAHVAVADLDGAGAKRVADAIGGSSFALDVRDAAAMRDLVASVEAAQGRIDLFASNAGILPFDPAFDHPADTDDETWQAAWQVNVMAHIYAARAVLPGMLARGEGYLLQTVSAAGLLTMIGSAAYATTKHAAIGLAESLAIAYRARGIGVSVLAPQAVATAMTNGKQSFGADVNGVLTSEQVADAAIAGMAEGRFLILPHPEVARHVVSKAKDRDRWLDHLVELRATFA